MIISDFKVSYQIADDLPPLDPAIAAKLAADMTAAIDRAIEQAMLGGYPPFKATGTVTVESIEPRRLSPFCSLVDDGDAVVRRFAQNPCSPIRAPQKPTIIQGANGRRPDHW